MVYQLKSSFQKDPDNQIKGITKEKIVPKELDKKDFFLCRQCRQIITSPSESVEKKGAHKHTFANLHGIVFEIGCFQNAPGCFQTGQAIYEWTWFSGFHWKVALCMGCLSHMGWFYISPSSFSFYGLILDNLVEMKHDG